MPFIDIMKLERIRTSRKGAVYFRTEDGREGWMKPAKAILYFQENKVTPGVQQAIDDAKLPSAKTF